MYPYRPYQSVRLRLSTPSLESCRPFQRATKKDDLDHSSIPRWHASMRAARRQGVLGAVCCGQGLRQGCVLAPLLFNIFFAAVINIAYKRFKADRYIMDALVHLWKKPGGGGAGGRNRQRASPEDIALGHSLS